MKRAQIVIIVLVSSILLLSTYLIRYLSYDELKFAGRERNVEIGSADLGDIPGVVHQMWKDPPHASIPASLKRWRDGCRHLNSAIEFKLYFDKDLSAFVKQFYPRYEPLFKSLHGVYMADMARVLLVYHYGGIYLDLDFYCHRPLHCLLHKVMHAYNVSMTGQHVLVVSREPEAHAILFRNKSRVVIQDFFIATPRHPFLLWLLEDRMRVFSSGVVQGGPVSKGPFSYAIEADLDRFVKDNHWITQMNGHIHRSSAPLPSSTQSTASMGSLSESPSLSNASISASHDAVSQLVYSTNSSAAVIVELAEDYVHPLVDQTNSRLLQQCSRRPLGGFSDARREAVCSDVLNKRFFRPSEQTSLVHMWSHVYLGWTFLRSAYSSATYRSVERALPPTLSCSK